MTWVAIVSNDAGRKQSTGYRLDSAEAESLVVVNPRLLITPLVVSRSYIRLRSDRSAAHDGEVLSRPNRSSARVSLPRKATNVSSKETPHRVHK